MARTRRSSAMSPVRACLGCSGWSRLLDHAAAVPAVRRALRAFGSVPRQNGGHSSCISYLVRTVHTVQQTVEISQVQFWFWLRLLLCNDICPGWVAQKTVESPQLQCLWASSSPWTRLLCPLVQRLWVAQCLVRLWIHVVIQGGFWENFDDFLREGVDSAPELDSRPARLARTSSITAVACSVLVLLV